MCPHDNVTIIKRFEYGQHVIDSVQCSRCLVTLAVNAKSLIHAWRACAEAAG